MTVFEKIINGDLPSYKIYEDDYTLAFLDIAKDVTGHTLVIPKKVVTSIFDCDIDTLSHVMNTVKLVSHHYVNNCGFSGINILNANDKSAGQSVDHLHFHIIPRKINDGINAWPSMNGFYEELSDTQKKLTMIK